MPSPVELTQLKIQYQRKVGTLRASKRIDDGAVAPAPGSTSSASTFRSLTRQRLGETCPRVARRGVVRSRRAGSPGTRLGTSAASDVSRDRTREARRPLGDAAHLARGKQIAEVAPGERSPDAGDGFGRAFGNDLAPSLPALGTEIDHVVSRFHDVEVVLVDDDGVASAHEAMQDFEETLDVGEVEPGGRLVEDVQGSAGRAPAELGRELDALRFASGQGRRGLAEMDVPETHVVERP